jgi:hypothetical protein
MEVPDMMTHGERLLALMLALALLGGPVPSANAALFGSDDQVDASVITPPRLSYSDGEVSFWRPGADDWAPAQINTPLAPGDELYTGDRSNLELQVGSRAYVRASGDTQLGLVNQDPDFLELKVTNGSLSVDLRSLDSGTAIEVDTPQAALTIERPGYYRVDVTQERTSIITRRGGRATVTPAGGQAITLAASEEMVLDGLGTPTVRSYVAPELDTWDRWNYARSEHLLETMSARYVPPGVYGTDTLDQYGSWREVATYGPVWVPQAVAPDWVPYSTGRWISDPTFGWTWVDTAPWGWAPYHYGRWVFVDGFWAWAPGPMVRRAVYSPALVVFFGGPRVRVAVGTPFVSWVALSWGEPVVPWWGRTGFVGRPWWGGWGGPRVVNNVVINQTTVVNVTNINVYRNVNVHNAVVAVNQEHFGRRAVHEARMAQVDVKRLEPVRGALRVTPTAASFVASSGSAKRPPESTLARPVVATRPLPARKNAARGENRAAAPPNSAGAPVVSTPAPRIVPAPKRAEAGPAVPARPEFGASPRERQRRSEPPTLETTQRPEAAPPVPHPAERRPDATPPVTREPGRSAQPAEPAERKAERQAERQERRSDATPPATREPGRAAQPAQPAPPAQQVQPPHPAQRQTERQAERQERRSDATPPAAREQGRPAQPVQPPQPAQPAQPVKPAQPAQPAPPAQPTARQAERQERRSDATPPAPRDQGRPAQPAQPTQPVQRAQPAKPAQPAQPTERQIERQERRTERQLPAQPAPQQRNAGQPTAPATAPAPAPAQQQRVEPAPPSPRPLPGEPANRLAPGRTEKKNSRAEEHARSGAPQPGAAAGPSHGPGQRQG